jgi:hypothetical protein
VGLIYWRARTPCDEAGQPFGGIDAVWDEDADRVDADQRAWAVIRLFVNAAAFSYWLAHPAAATHAISSVGIAANFTLEPGHATAAMFGLSGDSLVDWAAAKVPFLQKKIPTIDQTTT